MIRKLSTGLAVVIGVIALSATPAQARPVPDPPPEYIGPVTSSLFAGAKVRGCIFVDTGVFVLPGEFSCGPW